MTSGPNWTYQASICLPGAHCTLYRDDSLGVQRQILRRQRAPWFPGRVREYYFVDGLEQGYRSEQSLMRALHDRINRSVSRDGSAGVWRRFECSIHLT
jgi:hypothetical protein